jgi:mono/diheme cytochrome c family protein
MGMKTIKIVGVIACVVLIVVATFVWSGLYPIGADVPHYRATHWLLETLRDRAINRADREITLPQLDDANMLLSGGADYNDMCASCHLRPGERESDFSVGLYPSPPDLTVRSPTDRGREDEARRQFWIIKHGIKASGMPAWGKTHDDDRIWAMVAFLRQLPELSPEQYQILTARGEAPMPM